MILVLFKSETFKVIVMREYIVVEAFTVNIELNLSLMLHACVVTN